VTPAADQARAVALGAFRAKLAAIPLAGLSDEARLNRDFLTWTLDRQLSSLSFDEARMPFNSDGGFHQTLNYVATTTPIRTTAQARAWISRLRALPKFYEDNIANARRGVATGFTQPESTNQQVLERARAQAAAAVGTDPLMTPLAHLPAGVADPEGLRREAAAVISDQVRPAQRAFVAFLEKEYLPASRRTLGVRSVPGGEAYLHMAGRRPHHDGLHPRPDPPDRPVQGRPHPRRDGRGHYGNRLQGGFPQLPGLSAQ